ncbi:hypothetical protein ACLKA6_008009 [Drosophila palustris]
MKDMIPRFGKKKEHYIGYLAKFQFFKANKSHMQRVHELFMAIGRLYDPYREAQINEGAHATVVSASAAQKLHAIIDNWDDGASDEEHFGQNADAADIIITPPDVVDALSDNEELDDNVQLLREEVELPREIAGQFEVECVYDDQNEHIPTVCDDDMDAEEGDMSSTSSGRAAHQHQGRHRSDAESLKE